MTDRTKRPLRFLVLSIASFLAGASLVYFLPPDFQINFLNFQLPLLPLFFLLVFCFFFSAGTYSFNSKKHGILIACFVLAVLLFRLNNLVHPFFFVLLCGLFLMLELLFSYKK